MDEDNKAFKSLQKKKYVSQSDVDYGVNIETDHHADLYLEQMVEMYEERLVEIVLTDCDYKTPLGKKYKCTRIDKDKEYYLLNRIRDNHVLNEIEKSEAEKIVVVFGRIHVMDLHSKIKKEAGIIKKKNQNISEIFRNEDIILPSV